MRWRRWVVGLLMFGLAVGWCNRDSWAAMPVPPTPGGTLTIAVPDEPPGLDPTTSPAAAIARIVYNNLLEGLVKLNMQGEIVRALAERYVVSIDGTEYTFTLRQGVKFHNGRPLTADDVKFTLERNLDPHTGHPHRHYYESIRDIEVIDAHTVRIGLAKPDAMFVFNLARANSAIIAKEEVERLKSHPIGTGPFQFVEWVRGDRISLAKFKDYYEPGVPYLDRVVFRFIQDPSAQLAALRAGDVDVIGVGLSPESALELKADPAFQVIEGLTTTDVIVAMNNGKPPFSDIRVRKAITYAINRDEVIKGAVFGMAKPIGSHMDPLNPYYVDLNHLYEYDPHKAKQLLAEAGYPQGFEFVLRLAEPYMAYRRAGEIIAGQLAKVGLKAKIEILEWGQWLARIYRQADYDMTVMGHAEPFDIGIYANAQYYFRYDNPTLRALIKEADATLDDAKRKAIYGEVQRLIAEDAVNVFLYNGPYLVGMQKTVHNWWTNLPIPAIDVTRVYKSK
ncbi:MAG TPA: ABC transporter substrate-binding protein [Alphaproteobacteria bacterium]|nr:ABC transporter substrate-binding protein [Alphaproteobacteria bacterium]